MSNKNGLVSIILSIVIFVVGLNLYHTHFINPTDLCKTFVHVSSEFLLSEQVSADIASPISNPWENISLPPTIDPNAYTSSKDYTDALYLEAITFFENQELELPWKNILCIGDSITAGVQSGMEAPWPITYPEVLGSLYKIPTDNQGIGGSSIWSGGLEPMAIRIENCSHADAVFVLGGLNDDFFSCPIGDLTTPGTFTYDLNVFFHYLNKMYADSDIYIIIPMEPTIPALIQPLFDQIKEIERTFSQKYGFYVIDLPANDILSPSDPDVNISYYSDGCHPNSIGYHILGTIVAYEAIRLKCETP